MSYRLPSPGKGGGLVELFSLSVFQSVRELGAGRSGFSLSGCSTEMVVALLSSSMGVGLLFREEVNEPEATRPYE